MNYILKPKCKTLLFYTKNRSRARPIFKLLRAHPGAHCFVLIRCLFLVFSLHTVHFSVEPREAYQLMFIITKQVQLSIVFMLNLQNLQLHLRRSGQQLRHVHPSDSADDARDVSVLYVRA